MRKVFSAAVYDQGKDTDELVLLIEEYDRLHPHERLSLFSKIRDSLIRDVLNRTGIRVVHAQRQYASNTER